MSNEIERFKRSLKLSIHSAGCCFMQDLTEKAYYAIKQHNSKKRKEITKVTVTGY